MTATIPTTVPQVMLPGQAAAPEGPVDIAPMYLMHHAFRRDVHAFAAVVPTVAATDRRRWARIARRFTFFTTILHKHHSGEDRAMWPLLAEKGADTAVLDALQADHAGIDPLLTSLDAGLRALAGGSGDAADRDRVTDTAVRLRDALLAHLEREERDGMALVQRHLVQEDWDRLDREVFQKDYTAFEVPAVAGWVADGLSDEDLRRMPDAGPVLLAVARAMGRRNARRDARVFGGAR
ncbi:hemerythrin domain-containing protein [Blastococcus sp. URHD0036]|uniref:hemerythrin domain-containing protein n=1 Tax=Blastococcus sp. URHD0036 TaxID=1380356 RepID=UPI00068FD797|nr:hemerythrin domain-containing protein [Blastococcus sp. URHD0036]